MSTRITERLHDELHRLPGMPPHSDAALRNAKHPAPNRHHQGPQNRRPAFTSRNAHHANPPRMLVAWQTWIGDLFGQER